MFVVNIMPNNSNANISLAYKTEEKAATAHARLFQISTTKETESVSDDFGSNVVIGGESISHVVFIDVAKSQWREWEMAQAVEKVRGTLGKRSPLLAS